MNPLQVGQFQPVIDINADLVLIHLAGRLLQGTLLSKNPTRLEWTQTDLPRALKLSVSIESVK